jgi:lipoteichoic acid synthase
LPEKGWGVPDQDVMNYVEKRLPKGKTPFFVSIITMSSHESFDLPHFVHDTRFDGVEPKLTGRYFAAIAYTDRVVGEFVTNIQKKYPDTYFFLYGDHTPYVINNGPFRRSVLTKGEEMEMVPLFIITPNGRSRYEHDAVASYLDIAPTIFHAAGVPYSYRSFGVNLLTNMPLRQPVIYRGQPYNRAELFKEMSETYKDLWSNIAVREAT